MSDSEVSKKDGALNRPETDRAQGGDAPAFMTEEALLRLEEGLRARREQQEGWRFLEPDARIQRASARVINKSKSGVAKTSVRKFLGFTFTGGKLPRRRIAPQALARFKAKTRELTRYTRGRKLEQIVKELSVYLIGWRGYFGFCQTPSVLHSLDNWLQRRLRAIVWKQWKRVPTSSRPVSSPFGRRQKLGLLLCALLLTVAVAALRVSLKAKTGGSTDVPSVNIEAHGRMASMPPDNVEPRQPIVNAVKSSVATQASSRWNFAPLAAAPSLPPDNAEPRQPTRNAGKSSAATATRSLPPDNAEARQPTTNAGKSSAAPAMATLSLPPLPRHRPINNRSKRKGPPHQPTTNARNSSAAPAMATRSLSPDNTEARQLITKAGKSSAATPSLPPDGLTPSLVAVLRKLRVIARDAVDLPTSIVGKIDAALRGDPRLPPVSNGPAPEVTTNIAEE